MSTLVGWRVGPRGNLIGARAPSPPIVVATANVADQRMETPRERALPPVKISLPQITMQSVAFPALDAAMAARGLRA